MPHNVSMRQKPNGSIANIITILHSPSRDDPARLGVGNGWKSIFQELSTFRVYVTLVEGNYLGPLKSIGAPFLTHSHVALFVSFEMNVNTHTHNMCIQLTLLVSSNAAGWQISLNINDDFPNAFVHLRKVRYFPSQVDG